jgi:hypothetical protein
MNQNRFSPALNRLRAGKSLTHVKTLTSAVTTAWGVNWDEVYIARDLMQNVFDANRECLYAVRVEQQGADVRISAPSPFNLERLFYLGSEKGANDIGQYGEGFKVAATCLLRDHGVTPVAASGRDVLCLRVAAEAVTDTKLYPVEYEFYRSSEEIPGTQLLLTGCSAKLAKALAEGLSHFFHADNPLLGAQRWSSDYRNNFEIYDSTDGKGHVFYRGLKRGEIEDVPVILVINKQYEAIERKVSKDRDRNAFGGQLMELFFRHFARYGLNADSDGQRIIVDAARTVWPRGHSLLNAVAESARGWPLALAKDVFADRYFAHCSSTHPAEQLEIERLERGWRNAGRHSLPAYFSHFSVLNAEDEMRRVREQAFEESKRLGQRVPTSAENEGIHVLSKSLRDLAPEVSAVFDKGKTNYTVAETEALLGQLKSARSYRSREVLLCAALFVSDFPMALATFLHEHAHIFGDDGSRGFTDALTELLETVMRCRYDLDPFEKRWSAATRSVKKERQAAGQMPADKPIEDWLDSRSEADLRELMRLLPEPVLRRLREHTPKKSGMTSVPLPVRKPICAGKLAKAAGSAPPRCSVKNARCAKRAP